MLEQGGKGLVFDRVGIREVDRLTIETTDINSLALMEHAAEGVARVAETMGVDRGPALIACGPGNNGGDGWAAARLLHEAGCQVQVLATAPPRANSDAAINAAKVAALPIEVFETPEEGLGPCLIIDALLGTGLTSTVRASMLACIDWINEQSCGVLSVDLPSGMDADTGKGLPRCVQAAATATFVGVKLGMLQEAGKQASGDVHVIDIGVPKAIARRLAHKESEPHG
ncbi:MAG: NAD(P)H-hydrate epimerase [Phycisphaerales bacterium]|nr:NAD(P)H-hydrate epimerase [Phycisphaerales bacterium]